MIYYADQKKNKIRLLQSKKAKLSTFKSNEGTIKQIINCSFFAGGYVVGRNQGDESNDTVDQTNFEGNNIVIFKDGTYKIGLFNSWDYQNDVVAGFCPCAIFRNGQLEIAPTLKNEWTPSIAINRTALCYNDDGFHFIVETNVNYENFASHIWERYKPHFIAFLDSGGSSEIIEDGELKFLPSDGQERPMFNGLAFVEVETPTPEPTPTDLQKPIFPTKSTWVSQPMDGEISHKGLKAIDFGTWSAKSLVRLGLPSNYDYPITAPFDCKVVYRDSEAKGGGIALESIKKVTYSNGDVEYCTVWIGHSNDTPVLGTEFKQGDVVCHFGKAGTTAKHMHLEVIKGQFSKIYDGRIIGTCTQSVGKVYKLEQTIEPNLCLYFTKDTYVEDNPYDWKKLDEEPSETELEKLRKENEILRTAVENLTLTVEKLEKDLDKSQNKLDKINNIINK